MSRSMIIIIKKKLIVKTFLYYFIKANEKKIISLKNKNIILR